MNFGNRHLIEALGATLTVEPHIAVPKSKLTFTVTITNASKVGLKTVKVAGTLPAGVSFVSSNPAPDEIVLNPDGSRNLTWSNLPQPSTSVITIAATVDPDASGDLTAGLEVSGTSAAAFIKTISMAVKLTIIPARGQYYKDSRYELSPIQQLRQLQHNLLESRQA